MDIVSVLRGIIGVGVLLGIAFLLSNNKRNVNWKLVIGGLSIQLVLAFFLIKGEAMSQFFSPFGWVKDLFSWVGSFFVVLLQYSEQGASFVFGNLAISPGKEGSLGFFFAFQVLPTIIFFAALMSILYYLGIMQKVVELLYKEHLSASLSDRLESISVINLETWTLKSVKPRLKIPT